VINFFIYRRGMDLKTYLKKYKIKNKEFAKTINVHPNTISNYLCWIKRPSSEIATRIELATKGKVKLKDLMNYWEMKEKYG
jgi:DNA-binding transcriptional regulator YdaS (Cro superfamily)